MSICIVFVLEHRSASFSDLIYYGLGSHNRILIICIHVIFLSLYYNVVINDIKDNKNDSILLKTAS